MEMFDLLHLIKEDYFLSEGYTVYIGAETTT